MKLVFLVCLSVCMTNRFLSVFNSNVSECKAGKADEKVSELQEWLQPLKQIAAFNFDSSTVQELVLQLKQYTDDMSEIPKGLVTVVRILKYMAIGPEYKDAGKYHDEFTPFKHFNFII